MKISLNTIKQFIDFELPPVDELVARINAQLGGVDQVIELGAKYKDAKIVKVVECEKHSDADKLSVCQIDAGDNKLVQVVCGAPNVKKDMWTVWLPPESVVPNTYDDKEPFKLSVRELRGVMSHGMLASAKELDLGDDHGGIIEITERDLLQGQSLQTGASFAKVFEIDDTIVDIENKMFTHRPDCFGQLGVAREIAGILGHQFKSPKWYKEEPSFEKAEGLDLKVFNEAEEKVPRFMAVALNNIQVRPSPLWLQCELVRMGGKPINNIVDATNYTMFLTGQPTHAYDYDKLHGQTLGVRMAKRGEKVKLLNGKTYELDENDLIIVDGNDPVGLAGVMGGGNSEVSDETKNIVLECANFDMYTIRKMSMKYGLFTDAVTRFNKGQSPLQSDRVLRQLINILNSITHGESKLASHVFNLKQDFNKQYPTNTIYGPQSIAKDFVNHRLGLHLNEKHIVKILENVEFHCRQVGENQITIDAPFWRTDIELPEDLVEEIGRLYGFDKLPSELPKRTAKPVQKNSQLIIKQKIRESLKNAGANDVLTYSFVHENIFKKAEQDTSQAFQVSNALSPDLQYYRLSVLPSLLDKVHMNIKAGHNEFVLFEIGKGHNKKYHADDDNGLPSELEFVDVVYASKTPQDGAAYYHIKRLLEQLGRDLGFSLVFKPIEKEMDYPVTAPFDQARSALVETNDGIFIGMIGELKQTVIKNFKLPVYSAAMTLDLKGLQKAFETRSSNYQPLSRYPRVSQDISIKVATDISYQAIFQTSFKSIDQHYNPSVTPISIFQSSQDKTHKTITLHIELVSYQQTLTSQQAHTVIDEVGEKLEKTYQAQIV